jgi:hypothetical protein
MSAKWRGIFKLFKIFVTYDILLWRLTGMFYIIKKMTDILATIFLSVSVQNCPSNLKCFCGSQTKWFLWFSCTPLTFVCTGCLIKNASTHNFFIYYPISLNKKTEDMVFHALRSSYKIILFGVIFSSLR